MKKNVLFLVVSLVAVMLAAGAAVPVQFKVETDHADCLYRCGEKASFTITVTGKDGKKLSVGSFKAKLDNFGEKVLAEKRVDLAQGNPFTIGAAKDTPGKKRVYAIYMNGSVELLNHHSKKAVQPGCEIVVPSKKAKNRLSTAETMSIGTSAASIATMIITVANILK